ncbi:MAG: PhoX family protein [Rubrivivax sp.]|jgi:secreted PhoX family phosphatase|nr:PhoX family protein [Rubrivivax sp.]
MDMNRRLWIARGLAGMAVAPWMRSLRADAIVGDSPYGPLGPADVNGVALPAGFSARLLAVSGQMVQGTSHVWHGAPDGGACFATGEGGWVYVSNAELASGGVGALRFDAAGELVDAYTILSGTKANCAGGPTPWGTWLSCEEFGRGRVWECNPQQAGQGVARPAMGRFSHEAVAIDPTTGFAYLTEDDDETSRFYRFRPRRPGDLSAGVLEAAFVEPGGQVRWTRASPLRPYRGADSTAFNRGEGAWFDRGTVYFCTTGDDRVWALDTATDRIAVVYDAALLGAGAPLREPDNVTVHAPSGDIFVAEDDDDRQLVLLADAAGTRIAAPFMQLFGHEGSEVTGPAFSPDGTRLYFSSQRGTGGRSTSPGVTFEVSGPFRR